MNLKEAKSALEELDESSRVNLINNKYNIASHHRNHTKEVLIDHTHDPIPFDDAINSIENILSNDINNLQDKGLSNISVIEFQRLKDLMTKFKYYLKKVEDDTGANINKNKNNYIDCFNYYI